MAAAAEPFARLTVAIVQEILLHLPSPASLVRAALVSKYWGRVISSPAFLSHYRELYPSSPLLGFYFSDREFGLPAFCLNASVRSDPDLKAVVRVADLHLVGLEEDSGWRIRDSRNGHLLLCRAGQSGGDSFSIHNPVSRRLVTIPTDRPQSSVDYFADCLLLGDDDSFRVVSVQQQGGQIRAVEYDSGARQWCFHPWESPWPVDGPRHLNPHGRLEPMYAAGLIFWSYSDIDTLAIVLDCSSMNFSTCPVPVPTCPVPVASWYAIGEIEDGMGCLVCIDDPANSKTHGVLKVWLLKRNTGGITWEFSGKQIPVTKLLGPDARVRQVVQVTNGLPLISFNDEYEQFVIDLNKLSRHAEFDFHGRAYAYQMAWPPAGLAALQEICKDDVGLAAPLHDGDAAAQIDDVAYTEGPSDVVLRPLDDCGAEHVIAAEANNLVGTVEDGVALMQTETAAPSADLVEGIPHSSSTPVVPHGNLGALSTQQPTTALDEHLHEDCPGECHNSTCPQHRALPTKPRCEEKLQPSEDVPPEHKGQGPTTSHTRCNFDLDADVLELVEHGEAHLQLVMDILSKVKAKTATTGEARYSMIECPKAPITSEAICQDQLQVPVLDITRPEEFNLAVRDIAVSPTSSELRPPVLHPRQGNPFGSRSQVMDAKERRNKRDRERYASVNDLGAPDGEEEKLEPESSKEHGPARPKRSVRLPSWLAGHDLGRKRPM